jgi:hypothetical protein
VALYLRIPNTELAFRDPAGTGKLEVASKYFENSVQTGPEKKLSAKLCLQSKLFDVLPYFRTTNQIFTSNTHHS